MCHNVLEENASEKVMPVKYQLHLFRRLIGSVGTGIEKRVGVVERRVQGAAQNPKNELQWPLLLMKLTRV